MSLHYEHNDFDAYSVVRILKYVKKHRWLASLMLTRQWEWWAGVLLFISTSSLTGKCSRLTLYRRACPCVILSSARRSHLRAGNWDKETCTAREPAQRARLPENPTVWIQEAGQTKKAASQRLCHVHTTSQQSVTGIAVWNDARLLFPPCNYPNVVNEEKQEKHYPSRRSLLLWTPHPFSKHQFKLHSW